MSWTWHPSHILFEYFPVMLGGAAAAGAAPAAGGAAMVLAAARKDVGARAWGVRASVTAGLRKCSK